jgi:hypothetical protein
MARPLHDRTAMEEVLFLDARDARWSSLTRFERTLGWLRALRQAGVAATVLASVSCWVYGQLAVHVLHLLSATFLSCGAITVALFALERQRLRARRRLLAQLPHLLLCAAAQDS